jgi:hypothetical protein
MHYTSKTAQLLNTRGLYNKKEWKVKGKEAIPPIGLQDATIDIAVMRFASKKGSSIFLKNGS